VLGEWTFGGETGGKIEKFHLGWKVDRQPFPESTLRDHLDTGKASKSGSKQARRIENQARRIEEKLLV